MNRDNTMYLHLGIHVTGSTSIQKSIKAKENRVSLVNQGVHVVRSLPANHSTFMLSAFGDRPEAYHVNQKNRYLLEDVKGIVSTQKSSLRDELHDINGFSITRNPGTGRQPIRNSVIT